MENYLYNFGVIKAGTNTITDEFTHELRLDAMCNLAVEISEVLRYVRNIALVSSGAVGAGRNEVEDVIGTVVKGDIVGEQICAASGQPDLIGIYKYLFRSKGLVGLQLLLEKKEFSNEEFLTMYRRVLEHPRLIGIFNENDPACTTELKFTDNDEGQRMVVETFDADFAINLSEIGGVRENKDDPESVIPIIPPGYDWRKHVPRDTNGKNGRGGMYMKCEHLEALSERNVWSHIARYRRGVLHDILNWDGSQPVEGTRFLAKP